METTEQRIVEELTAAEKELLKKVISGYGKLSNAARLTKLHFQTVKNVATIGRGEKNTIQKIRQELLSEKAVA